MTSNDLDNDKAVSSRPALRPEVIRERIRQLRLMDDRFMQACFQNNVECVGVVLRIILGKPDLVVKSVNTQKALTNLRGHDIRLDVFAVDSANRPYDIEIQRNDAGAQPGRARYYSSMLDANLRETGKNYELLPESYVIFITEHDVLKMGQPLYKIERQIIGTDRMFGDGAHIIYVNGEMRKGDTALARLMHDFFCTDPKEMYYSELARVVAFHKTDREEVRKMSGVFESFAEEMRNEGILIGEKRGISIGKEQGISIGEERGREEGISIGTERAGQAFARRLLADGFPVEDIARYTSLSLEEVRALAERSE